MLSPFVFDFELECCSTPRVLTTPRPLCSAVAVITASGVMRGTKRVDLKSLIDAALVNVDKVGVLWLR